MAKPWEEEWRIDPCHRNWVCIPSVYATDGLAILAAFSGPGGHRRMDVQRANLAVTSPRLYRALEALAALYDTDDGCRSLPEYVEAMAALKAARGEE